MTQAAQAAVTPLPPREREHEVGALAAPYSVCATACGQKGESDE